MKRLFFPIFIICLALTTNLYAQTCSIESVLKGINAYRTSQGLPPLHANTAITSIAKGHSANMASNQVPFSHDGFKQRMQRIFAEFPATKGLAENVAFSDRDDTDIIVNQWLGSRLHRKNILGNYNLTGIGIAHGDHNRVYITQIFVKDDEV
jgi:uncharacterized protein YkwD